MASEDMASGQDSETVATSVMTVDSEAIGTSVVIVGSAEIATSVAIADSEVVGTSAMTVDSEAVTDSVAMTVDSVPVIAVFMMADFMGAKASEVMAITAVTASTGVEDSEATPVTTKVAVIMATAVITAATGKSLRVGLSQSDLSVSLIQLG
jgi:hypothetical protein